MPTPASIAPSVELPLKLACRSGPARCPGVGPYGTRRTDFSGALVRTYRSVRLSGGVFGRGRPLAGHGAAQARQMSGFDGQEEADWWPDSVEIGPAGGRKMPSLGLGRRVWLPWAEMTNYNLVRVLTLAAKPRFPCPGTNYPKARHDDARTSQSVFRHPQDIFSPLGNSDHSGVFAGATLAKATATVISS